MAKLLRNNRGSYTIEASMVFTIVLLAILALMFTFAYMLQKVAIMQVASYTARQGADLWLDSRKDPDNGLINADKDRDSVYYRVFDNLLFQGKTFEWKLEGEKANGNSLPGYKASLIEDALSRKLKSLILKPKETSISINYSNNLLKGQLTVTITQEIKVPLGGIKAFFDGKDTMTLKASAVSTIEEPAEYIRNIDLAVELSKSIESGISLEDIINRIGSVRAKDK
ncbi:MAG: TadE/TadG family type IV pilus assembly protein [Caulobacteraceae bacterium]